MDGIYHIAEQREWERAQRNGKYAGSTLGIDIGEAGFVHCCLRHQVAPVANRWYRVPGEFVVLEVDPGRAAAEVRMETLPGKIEAYPHLHGAIPPAAVLSVQPLLPGPGGSWPRPNPGAAPRSRRRRRRSGEWG